MLGLRIQYWSEFDLLFEMPFQGSHDYTPEVQKELKTISERVVHICLFECFSDNTFRKVTLFTIPYYEYRYAPSGDVFQNF